MPDKSKDPFHFWQELKRRKVVKVVIVYAGAAYVIIELVNNISVPLQLPEWIATLVILLLAIGFPVVAILSWIFDITPEGVRKTESIEEAKKQALPSEPVRRKLRVSDVIIVVLIVAVGILVYPKVFKKDKFEDIRDEKGRISVAVMPFENLTRDTTLNWFRRGIASLMINGLGSSSELAVRDDQTMYEVIESMDQTYTAGLSLSLARETAKKVRAGVYITGSCLGSKDKFKILANLVDTESGDIIWSHSVEGNIYSSEYLDMANSLCNSIRDYLEIKALKQEIDYDFREAYTESSEAYKYFIEGMNSILTLSYNSAIESFNKALKIDSSFTLAKFFIAWAYINDPKWQWEYVEPWIKKAYKGKDKLPFKYQLWVDQYYAYYISKNLPDIIKSCNLLENSNIHSRLLWFDLGVKYLFLDYPEKAVKSFEKIEQINNERGDNWEYRPFYTSYGEALHKTGKHEKEAKIYQLGLKICPEVRGANDPVLNNQAICALSRGDTIQSNRFLQKIKNRIDGLGYPEYVKDYFIGYVYEDANMLDKAKERFRKLYDLAPRGDRIATYTWGRCLIKYDINVDKGTELIKQVLALVTPEDKIYYVYLLMESMGYYKQGNYEEALPLIKRAEKGWVGYYPELHQLKLKIEQALSSQAKN